VLELSKFSIKEINMNTAVKFLILYLIPILSIAITLGTYALVYGTYNEGFVGLVFIIVLLGLIASCYITIILVSRFLAKETIYFGIIFSILGCLLEFASVIIYTVIFEHELHF
jgi:hypothetical protein